MEMTNPLQETIQTAVTGIIKHLSAHKAATSWQLKVKLRLSSSVLYLALGQLLAQDKITLEADGINYVVTWGKKAASSPVKAAPFQAQL